MKKGKPSCKKKKLENFIPNQSNNISCFLSIWNLNFFILATLIEFKIVNLDGEEEKLKSYKLKNYSKAYYLLEKYYLDICF